MRECLADAGELPQAFGRHALENKEDEAVREGEQQLGGRGSVSRASPGARIGMSILHDAGSAFAPR